MMEHSQFETNLFFCFINSASTSEARLHEDGASLVLQYFASMSWFLKCFLLASVADFRL